MSFTVLPAVDVAGGRAVRFVPGGGAESPTGDPLATALAWQAGGASWIHLVDLDAAYGRRSDIESLSAVIGGLEAKVELSGGICDDPSLERAVATGCERVVLGTAALEDPTWCAQVIATHGARIAVALDVRALEGPDGSLQHRLAARGGSRDGGDLWAALARLDEVGCARYVVTDVGRDGTLRGPNIALYQAVTRATPAAVIASGGISTLDDLLALAAAATDGGNLEGAIVGTALHAGRFTVSEALAAVRSIGPPRGLGA